KKDHWQAAWHIVKVIRRWPPTFYLLFPAATDPYPLLLATISICSEILFPALFVLWFAIQNRHRWLSHTCCIYAKQPVILFRILSAIWAHIHPGNPFFLPA